MADHLVPSCIRVVGRQCIEDIVVPSYMSLSLYHFVVWLFRMWLVRMTFQALCSRFSLKGRFTMNFAPSVWPLPLSLCHPTLDREGRVSEVRWVSVLVILCAVPRDRSILGQVPPLSDPCPVCRQ